MLEKVQAPTKLQDAVEILAESRTAAVLSGGTLLMAEINTKPTDLKTLISTKRLGIDGVRVDGARATVGAAATLDALGRDARLAVLRPVIESIASPPIRNLATVGGNLFAAQPHGDLAVALLALDAEVEIAGANGTRRAPVAQVFRAGVGAAEIVTSIRFDIPDANNWRYTKAMRRKLNSAAIVTVAARITLTDGAVSDARIALGGAGTRPVLAQSAAAALIGRKLDDASVNAAAAAAVNDAEPFTDAYASAWYRARVLPVHVRRALLGA